MIATIKPVHSLVAAVMKGVAEPDLLLEGRATPHSFQLSPDHTKRLSKADVVFLINRRMESFLGPSLKGLVSKRAAVTELSGLPGVVLRPMRSDPLQVFPQTGSDTDLPVSLIDGQVPDFHIWLSVHNAIAMTKGIAAVLCKVDPPHCGAYESNAVDYADVLRFAEKRLDRRVAGLRGRRYVISHDSIQYFEIEHNLGRGIPIMLSPEGLPGVKRLHRLRRAIDSLAINCVLIEPQFPQELAKMVTENKVMRVANIDILGADLPAGPEAYLTILNRLADQLASCLA